MSIKKRPQHICKSVKDAFVYDGYRNFTGRFRLGYIFGFIFQPAYSAIVLFRLQQYFEFKSSTLASKKTPKLVKKRLASFYYLAGLAIARLNFLLNAGFEASSLADVSPGLFIHHPQGIIIGGDTRIGANCHLFKNVLFGVEKGAYPIVKNNVTLFANSVIIGGVTLHDNVVVTPNSVVINDVEEGLTVAGAPAKPIGETRLVFIQKHGVPVLVPKNEVKPNSGKQ